MQFIVYTEDKDDGAPIRVANRDAHLEWLKSGKGAKVLAAGPWLDDEGTMKGSLLIVEAESRAAIEAWAATDPYAIAELPKSVMIKAYKWVIGAP